MALTEYIRELILFREKLVLPGIGTLEIHREPAKIEGKNLQPARSNLVFNPDFKTDDGTLSTRLAEAEDLDPEEARQQVLEFCDSVLFSLNKGEAFVFPELGTLSADDDNRPVFTVSPDFEKESGDFGLSAFELEPIETDSEEEPLAVDALPRDLNPVFENIPEKPEPEIINKPEEPKEEVISVPEPLATETDSDLHIPEEEPVYELYDDEKPVMKETRKNNRNTLWILTGAAAVILAGFIIVALTTTLFNEPLNIKLNSSETEEALNFDEEPEEEVSDAEFNELLNSLEKDIDESTKPEVALQPEQTPEETVPDESSSQAWHIIAGSFKAIDNARELQQKLTMQGYQSMIIEKGDGIYRVSARSFSSKEEALQELAGFRRIQGMSGAWVLNLQ